MVFSTSLRPAVTLLQKYKRFFYLSTPNETSFEKVEDVPDYVNETFPLFVSLLLIENVVLWLRGRKLARFNDGMSSLSAGLISLLHSLLFRDVELTTYIWAYETINVVVLPWDSTWTWVFCMVGVDFAYYWAHRLSHEVNILWASHQVHHSSEDYNLTTALRQSAFQKYISWVVDTVGVLEYVICTPSHHRVHHGRNPYCIDKNYGGVFIVWDRIFGTFQAEMKDHTIAYGLVETLDSWCPLNIQLCQALKIMHRLVTTDGIRNKMAVLWKGPGWAPGKPRLGVSNPRVKYPVVKYDRGLYTWASVYVWAHYVLNVLLYLALAANNLTVPMVWKCAGVLFIIISLTSFGALYDNKWYAVGGECTRCSGVVVCTVLLWSRLFHLSAHLPLVAVVVYSLSSALWLTSLLGVQATQPFPQANINHDGSQKKLR